MDTIAHEPRFNRTVQDLKAVLHEANCGKIELLVLAHPKRTSLFTSL